MPDVASFEELRPKAFAIAYRMLGSVSEAEDVVQEAFLRLHGAVQAGERIESPRAYLSTVVTRLGIDQLRSARARRETYVGEWLPEPLVVTSEEEDPARQAEVADSLSLAFLVLLESLSPEQRAVFLLREVFDYPYDQIAEIVGKSEDNVRQLAVRARRHVEEGGRASTSRASSATSSRIASSRPRRKASWRGWRRCWPRMSSCTATAAARRPRSRDRCMGATGWRALCAPGDGLVRAGTSPCAGST